MPRAVVTINFCVPPIYRPGDYCVLYGDDGLGVIDYDTPLSGSVPLFPGGAGTYGFYRLPWGKFPWYHGASSRCPGFYHAPWGRFPWYHGAPSVSAQVPIAEAGTYLFAFKCFDRWGNPQASAPEEIEVVVDFNPDAPAGLKKVSYNKTTKVLVLDVAA